MTIYVVRRKFNSCQDSMHIAVLQTLEEALSPKEESLMVIMEPQ